MPWRKRNEAGKLGTAGNKELGTGPHAIANHLFDGGEGGAGPAAVGAKLRKGNPESTSRQGLAPSGGATC